MSYKAVLARHNADSGEEEIIVHRWDDISSVQLSAEVYGSQPGMTAYFQVAAPVVSGQLTNDGQSLIVGGRAECGCQGRPAFEHLSSHRPVRRRRYGDRG